MKREYQIADETHEVLLGKKQGTYQLTLGDRQLEIAAERLSNGEYMIDLNGRKQRASIASDDETTFIHIAGRAWAINRIDPFEKIMGGDAAGASGSTMLSPMPGTVISVHCEAGQSVSEGETLMVIESMKLETSINAPRDGIVDQVGFVAGDTFDQKALLVSLEIEDE